MEKKVIVIFLIYINCLAIISCNMFDPGITLPGKIAIERVQSDSCVIYIDSNRPTITFKLRNDKEVRCGGLYWLNGEDNFLGSEAITGSSRAEYKCNIAKFNLSGKLIDTIYASENGEIAWVDYPSRDDKYLL